MKRTIPDIPEHVAKLIRNADSAGWRMAHVSDAGMFFVRGDRRPILTEMMCLAFMVFTWSSITLRFFQAEAFHGVFLAALVFVTVVLGFFIVKIVRRYSVPSRVETRFISAEELADPNCPPVL